MHDAEQLPEYPRPLKDSVSRWCRSALLAGGILATFSIAAFAANGSVTYTYDALGRVTSASYDTNVVIFYHYDANGNRTQQTVNINTGMLCWGYLTGTCTTFTWGAGTWGP